MQIDAQDVINRLLTENSNLLQRAVIAEAQAEALEKQLQEQEEENGS